MDAFEISVERAFDPEDDRVLIQHTTAFGTFPIRLTPAQARELTKYINRFADSADPEVPYIEVPLAKTMLHR